MVKIRPTAAELGVAGIDGNELLEIREALQAADIPFLLIRDTDDRIAVAIDSRFGVAVDRALPEMSAAVRLEFWDFRGDAVHCPHPNALTRTTFELADVTITTVDLLGCSWPTLSGMFEAHTSDVGFDIDIVFSWVDGTVAEFRACRADHLANAVVGEGDDADARIRQIDELRYALRSVDMYAPWIRRIFIATDSPTPSWLSEHPKVTVVRAEQHFSDRSNLPTFNSHAVESQLHHIHGLSEHFLYANDDMFFARPVRPSTFFSPGGISKFMEAGTRIGPGGNHAARSGFENAARVNRALLADRFGQVITRHLEHTPAPLRRSVLLELEEEFPEDFARTRDSRFRSATDISVTNSLYHYYALFTGRAVPQESARMQYVDTTSRLGLDLLDELRVRDDVDFFCLNDGSFPEVDEAQRVRAVREFLADRFPNPAPWERDSEPVRQLRLVDEDAA